MMTEVIITKELKSYFKRLSHIKRKIRDFLDPKENLKRENQTRDFWVRREKVIES